MALVLKRILLLLARVGVGLGVAVASLYFLAVLPHQRDLEKAKTSRDQVVNVQKALDTATTQLKNLPQPSSIVPGVMGSSKDFVGRLDTILPTLNPGQIEKPEVISRTWFDGYIEGYNKVISKKGNVDTLAIGLTALGDDLDFLNHYRATMFAVANLIEYNPDAESKDKQPSDISPALQAAAAGIDRTITRLNEAPKFKDDSLGALIDEVKNVEAARKAYESALSTSPPALNERSAYIAAVAAAQKAIIVNRQQFWLDNFNSFGDKTNQAAKVLQPFSTDLQNL